ncbi:MAG: hypothetical protein ACJ739_12245 [Acidimicrobiales bacterium]
MDDRRGSDPDSVVVSEAYAAARDLLRHAEEDAARIRADADRYRRQREQEAELIVGKARRLLTMAEDRVANPRPVVIDVDAALPPDPEGEAPAPAVAPRAESALDAILATAVSNAVHRALPSDG